MPGTLVLLVLTMAAVSAPASALELQVGVGAGGGFAAWDGWLGGSGSIFLEGAVRTGPATWAVRLLASPVRVAQGGRILTFANLGALVKGRYRLLEAGAGYGCVPCFETESGVRSPGRASLLLSVGLRVPLYRSARVEVSLGAEDVFVPRLGQFYNPAVTILAARHIPVR